MISTNEQGTVAVHPAETRSVEMWSPIVRLQAALVLAVTVSFGSGVPRSAELDQPASRLFCNQWATLTCEELVALGYAYPYAREAGSYLFVNGAAYPYFELALGLLGHGSVQVGNTVLRVADLLHTLGLADRVTRRRTPVIAYGSNATVSALTRKYVAPTITRPAVIPVTRALLNDYDVVWSPHLVYNGVMPATIVRSPGTAVEVWLTWLDDTELQRMHNSEGVGTLYSYGTLAPTRLVSEVPLPEPPRIYIDCYGALALNGVVQAVAGVPATGRQFPAIESEKALREIAALTDWTGSVFALVLDNARSPARRAERTRKLATLGRFIEDADYRADCPCGTASCQVP
jgi:hypothetical protein